MNRILGIKWVILASMACLLPLDLCTQGIITQELAAQESEDAKIRLDLPHSGWRNSAGKKVKFRQKVNYPYSEVSTPKNQSDMGKIKGRARNSSGKPYLMIVNGVPMPLKVDYQGRFERPFSFSRGSNSVQIQSPDGKQKVTTQFYEAYVGRNPPKLRILLSWDTGDTDLDLHVVTPKGEHCYYSNRTLGDGSALDVDVTSGYGPEIYASPEPEQGTYQVYINYYNAGSQKDLTLASVTAIFNEGTADEKQQSFQIPLRKTGELTLVTSFVYP